MSVDLFKTIIENPIPYAHKLGLDKLNGDMHREWIRRAFFMGHTPREGAIKGTQATQGHRGSYKSSCVRVGLGLRMIGLPFANTIMMRKTDPDVKDIMMAISKDLQQDVSMEIMKSIYGFYPKLTTNSYSELELSTYCGVMGRQLIGIGTNTSVTGKHGPVLTDDIITVKDRVSTAERERTKYALQELVNIASEEEQHLQHWGTPWHKDDGFTLMPSPEKYDVYSTGILTESQIKERKDGMTPSLFAANYELKHVADGDSLFCEPKYGPFPIGAKAYAHIDAAYGGADSCSFTIIAEVDGKLHTVGWKMEGHIDNHLQGIVSKLERFQVHACAMEDNADKGYLKKELAPMTPTKLHGYHESMNKYYKISSFGKSRWKDVIFDLEEGDPEYVEAITDYNENSTHDDCPDDYASLVRWKYKGKKGTSYH